MELASLLPVILIAAAVMAVALSGMAIGVMISGKRIEGSCGGLANANLPGHEATSPCMACGEKPETCDRPGADRIRQAIREDSERTAAQTV